MSTLETAKGFIARGDKDGAIPLLASILLKNKDDLEAWLLLGDMIEDPFRKKLCYKQVLRLSPSNSYALTRLQELVVPPPASSAEITVPKDTQTRNQGSLNEPRRNSTYLPNRNFTPPARNSQNSGEIIGYVIGGIAGFLVILSVLAGGTSSSGNDNALFVGLIFLSLVVGIIVLSVSSRNRG